MRVSSKGLAEIISHEGIVLSPYRDSVGVWSWGVGHTASAGPPNPADMAKGVDTSLTAVIETFRTDVRKFEARVARAFSRALTQEQFDAAVSFDFNTGSVHRATWVRKWNAGDDAGARKAFMDWRKPRAIIPRREKERDLFFAGKYSSDGTANVFPADMAGRVLWSKGWRANVTAILGAATAPPVIEHEPVPEQAKRPSGAAAIGAGIALVLAGMAALFRDWLAALWPF